MGRVAAQFLLVSSVAENTRGRFQLPARFAAPIDGRISTGVNVPAGAGSRRQVDPSKRDRCNAPSQLRRRSVCRCRSSTPASDADSTPSRCCQRKASTSATAPHLVGTPSLGRSNTTGVDGARPERDHRTPPRPVQNPASAVQGSRHLTEGVRQEGGSWRQLAQSAHRRRKIGSPRRRTEPGQCR